MKTNADNHVAVFLYKSRNQMTQSRDAQPPCCRPEQLHLAHSQFTATRFPFGLTLVTAGSQFPDFLGQRGPLFHL